MGVPLCGFIVFVGGGLFLAFVIFMCVVFWLVIVPLVTAFLALVGIKSATRNEKNRKATLTVIGFVLLTCIPAMILSVAVPYNCDHEQTIINFERADLDLEPGYACTCTTTEYFFNSFFPYYQNTIILPICVVVFFGSVAYLLWFFCAMAEGVTNIIAGPKNDTYPQLTKTNASSKTINGNCCKCGQRYTCSRAHQGKKFACKVCGFENVMR